MAKPARILLINYSQTDAVVAVETTDEIKYHELRKDADPTHPDGPAEGLTAGAKNLVVPAGRLFGFATQDLVTIGGSDPFATQDPVTIGGSDPKVVVVGVSPKLAPTLQAHEQARSAVVIIVRGAVGGGRDPWPQPPPPPPALKGFPAFGPSFSVFLNKIPE